ncbi:microcin C transport system substrate-binding protein [Albidovulum inexpectatum]|uniref:Microcin C transport system substrate-binding protein n=1 Tax=Albidovulum inexpectatum TaxID=196587 RepID=A0A2S5JLB3_9RHOB|nr:extracellular solute-binding protein [Albidovulum inexpectatum]PPB82191.1 microcin C transport system substrate-binding protein [Albidovulum inexpectatum]
MPSHQVKQNRFASLCAAAFGAIWAFAQPGMAQDVTISHAYSNFGAIKYPADVDHLDYVNPDAPKGGEISIWAQGGFDSFNQYASDGVPAALNTIGSESILISTDDDPYALYCYLCTTLEYPADLSFVTFNLRDDVTFADGTPMTAEDVAFSFQLFQTQGILEYRRVVEGFIDRVEVEGPYRITFHFTDKTPMRDRVGFAGGTPVFSKAWFERTGARLDRATKEPFMSTGPFVLDSFDFKTRVIYRRNPNFWGADHPFNRGRWNFDRIRVEYFADSDAAFEGFKAGDYTFRTENSSQQWAAGYDFQAMRQGWIKREEIPDGNVGTRLSWVFNLDRPNWQDGRVRDAIAMMFNYEWARQTLQYGLYERPVSFWPNTDLAASGTPDEGELAILKPLVDEGLFDPSILTEEARVPIVHDPANNRPSRRILREAARLLEEAGWQIGDDGLRRNDRDEVLELTIIQYSPIYDKFINPFIENLALIGVRGRLERVDISQYVERRRKGDFDLANQGFDMDFEPSGGLEQWFGSKTADDSSRNLMRLRHPGIDRLIQTVVAASTLEELKTAVHALDRGLRKIGFDIPLWYNPETWVAYYDFYRHPENLPPLSVGELDLWWYDAEAAERLKAAGAF